MTTPWPTARLFELVDKGEISYGIVQPGKATPGGVPIVRVKDIRNGVIDPSDPLLVAPEIAEQYGRTTLRGGELLVSIVGTVGEAAVVPDAMAGWNVARAVAVIRPTIVSSDWIKVCLQTSPVRSALNAALNTTVQATLNLGDLKRLEIPIPPRVEREGITEVLGALDNKLATNERICALLAELSLAVFLRATVDGYLVTVSDVALMIARGIAPKYVETDGVTVLNQKCIREHVVSLGPARLTAWPTKREDKLLRRNDVLVNSTGQGTLGRVARWLHDVEATVDSHISIVRFDSSLIDPVCAGYALSQLESQIEALAEGSTGQTELRRDLLAGLSLAVPQREAQKAVGETLSSFDVLAMQIREESQRIAATRDELLPSLMSGRIRVRNADKVVEEVV